MDLDDEEPLENVLDCEMNKHTSDVNCCHFSKTGLLASCSSDQTVRLWTLSPTSPPSSSLQEHPLSPLLSHTYGVNFCRFSPHGTILATASTDGTTILWDVKSGEQLCSFVQPSGLGVRVCEFCPHSGLLATAGDDDTIYIWDIGARDLVRTISSHEATVFALAFSPDGTLLLTTDTIGRIKVWSTQQGHHKQLAGVEEAHDLGVMSAMFSPVFNLGALTSGFSAATCGNDGFVKIWAVKSGVKNRCALTRKVYAHSGNAMCVAYSPNGAMIASAGGDKLVKVWNAEDLASLFVFRGHSRYVATCTFDRTGCLLASGSNDRSIKVWNVLVRREGEEGRDGVKSPFEGKNAKSPEAIYQVKLTSNKSETKLVQKLTSHKSDVTCCDVFGDRLLATGSSDKTIRLWELVENQDSWTECKISPLLGHSYTVYALKFSSSENLASASLDGTIAIWNLETGEIVKTFQHPEKIGFRALQISTAGEYLVAGGDDDNAHIWQLGSGRVRDLVEHVNTVFAVDISPDDKYVATCCNNGTLKLWHLDLERRSSLMTKEEVHDLGVTCCAFSPTIESEILTLVTGGNDAAIRVWQIEEKPGGAQTRLKLKHTKDLSGHGTSIMCLRYSPSGDLVGSTSGDKTARIWDASHYRCLQVLEQHTRYVTCCAFTRDSRWFITGFENVLNVWKLSGSIGSINGKDENANPVVEWGINHVGEWLQAQGFQKHVEIFKEAKVTGKILLGLNENGLKGLGLDSECHGRILECIQWARFGHTSVPQQAKDSDDVPSEFLCPITHDVMVEPVMCDDGFVYEAAAIQEWLISRKQTSPMTNLPVKTSKLDPQIELKQKIKVFMET